MTDVNLNPSRGESMFKGAREVTRNKINEILNMVEKRLNEES